MRIAILVLAIVGLGAAIWLLWPDSPADEAPGTEAVASSTTTSTTQEPPTTTTVAPPTSTTSLQETHVVESVEEAEAILLRHYSRWFSGIYEEDESLIRSTVILESQVQAAVDQFGIMDFENPPDAEGVTVSGIEILRSDRACLAVWAEISASFREGASEGVLIFRHVDGEWKFLSSWQLRDDLWEPDCESQL
jgi:hypothetical protein